MQCPRCRSSLPAAPDVTGVITCPMCSAHLRTRSRPPAPAAAAPGAGLGVGTDAMRAHPAVDGALARAEAAALAPAAVLASASAPGLDVLLEEIRAVRRTQAEILGVLRTLAAGGGAPPSGRFEGMEADDPFAIAANASVAPPPPVRTRRRKSALLIDDDPETLAAARAALEAADVPVRVARNGSAGLAALAEEKPDVLAMELDIGGAMGGKDVINMIKATMEWVDVPIVLYTRLPIESQREARQIHGADEFVLKASGPETLVARVIAVFRKG